MTHHEPIEDYLDELLSCLRLPPRATRRLLAETESHLREAAEMGERAGASPLAAEREAVSRFGTPAQVAAAASAARRTTPLAAAGVLGWAALLLGGVALVGVGISGALAAAFNQLAGRAFVGALPHTYGAVACQHFLAVQPGAPNCAAAAVLENSADAVVLRLVAGGLGLIMCALAWWFRRYLSADPSARRIRSACVAATAALGFGAAAVLLMGMSIDTALYNGSNGVGWYLSGGLVSTVAALVAIGNCWRHLRRLRMWRQVEVTG